jgi:hypothetical protein
LIPLLETSAPARIISVSSGGMYTGVRPAGMHRVNDNAGALQPLSPELGQDHLGALCARVDSRSVELLTRRLQASSPRCRVSTRRQSCCYARLKRAPTRSFGSVPPPSQDADPAASGRTADSARPTARAGPRRHPRTANGSGLNASASAAGTTPNSGHCPFKPIGEPDGSLQRNRGNAASPRRRVRVPKRLLHDRAVRPRHHACGATRRRPDRGGHQVQTAGTLPRQRI